MMANNVVICLFVIAHNVFQLADTYKILIIPMPFKSHVFPLAAIGKGLIDRGHNVTMLLGRNFPYEVEDVDRQRNFNIERYEDFGENYNFMYEEFFSGSMEQELDIGTITHRVIKAFRRICQHLTVQNNPMLEELNKIGFDMAVVDGHRSIHYNYLIPHRLKIPFVTYLDTAEPSLIGMPWLPSVVPYAQGPYRDHMTFLERLRNTLSYAVLASYNQWRDIPDSSILDQYQQYGSFGSLDELARKSFLWLFPRDPILDYPLPTMPNFIQVGGLTARYSSMRISENLESFVESAEFGSIVVSFGSVAPEFPPSLATKFVNVFRQLKGVHVVWRWDASDEDRSQVALPSNVRVLSWIPQCDLLANPKVKLFITHCGNSGQYEALYYGVPMIGFPLFIDQKYNAGRMISKGFGISMNIHSFTEDELLFNIQKVLSNESYTARITKASQIFRSAPMNPVETASYWIEHVCKFGGEHLQSGGRHLPLYAFWMLDVLAFVVLIAIGIICILIRFICVVWELSYREKARKHEKSN